MPAAVALPFFASSWKPLPGGGNSVPVVVIGVVTTVVIVSTVAANAALDGNAESVAVDGVQLVWGYHLDTHASQGAVGF